MKSVLRSVKKCLQGNQINKFEKFKKLTVRFASVFFMLCAFGLNQKTIAQTANQYTFVNSASASLVLDRNGNNIDMTIGTTQIVNPSQDDQSSSVTNIGFSFTFMSTSFTQFSASSNGVIRLGGTAISNSTYGNAFPVASQSIIAPYLQDLKTSSTGKVHYKVIGSSPNRTLVVEFLNLDINYGSNGADGTFQVRLYEQSNIIEFVYGAMTVGSTTTSGSTAVAARTASIGFSNNTGLNNEFSINQTTYATTTAATPITNTNSSTGTLTGLNGTVNGSLRSFTFAPPLTVTATSLTAFGPNCINTTAGPNSFTINGYGLSAANVTVGALAGYTYSTTSGGAYTTSLSLTQPGGTYTQQIFVKFTPTLVQSYSGNIPVGGGGATSINVAASGSGVNSPPTVTAGAASGITLNSATIPGTITVAGCTAVTAYGVEYSTTNNFVNGTGTAVAGSNLSSGNFSVSLTGLIQGTTYYYHTFATNGGGTSYSAQGSFATPTPALTASALTAFGSVCINTTAGPNPFTVTGTNLTTANVTVGPLSGYTYSTTSGGTYTTSLSLSQAGGSYSQQIFVDFTPTAVQSYSGNIAVGGGGAVSINAAASGSGVNTAPTVTTTTASAITLNSATVPGTITVTGCTAITAYGVEYSTTNAFANGAGTFVAGSNLAGGTFSVNLSGLNQSTIYYYHAVATNSGGTSYSAQGNFTTLSPTITTGTITGSPFCVTASTGAAVSVPFTSAGSFSGNTYTAQLSSSTGVFPGTNIGTLVSNANSGTISATIPANTATASGYLIRVISSGPAVTGSSSSAVTINRAANSIAPTATQNIITGANGTTLTVTELSTPTSRTWFYGTTSGGPYSSTTGVTATTYTPNFATPGTFYVVCVSTFACATITSNQVQVNVAPTYKSQFISMNTGSATWCAGETRDITVTVKNVGTGAWTDIPGTQDFNIGVKWNTNAGNWADYHVRTDAGNLAPGATGTYTLTLTASNNPGTGYTTTLSGGSNNLTFDVVEEAISWFGDNGGNTGPGNVKFISTNITINAPATPGITVVNNCNSSVLTATGTTGTLLWSTGANTSSITVSTGGTYTVTQTISGCTSAAGSASVTITASPVTTGVSICPAGSGSLASSTTCATGSPTSVGPKNAGTGTDNNGVGTGTWTAPGNITTTGTPYATQNLSANATSHYLQGTSYGFVIPANATINGITVIINRQVTGTSNMFDNIVRLLQAGTLTGNNLATGISGPNWPNSFGTITYGSASNLWGTTWTPAQINATNFGVSLSAISNSGSTRQLDVDYIQITVTYTVPGSINWYTVSSGGSSIGSGSSFNPVGVAGSGLANTNTAGTTIYYAECSSVPGCRTPTNFVINPLPTVSFSGLAAAYCVNNGAVTLTGNQAPSGSFSGTGVTDNGNGTASFNPATAGAGGPYTITYSYTNGNGCTNTSSQNVIINALPAITVQPVSPAATCSGSGTQAISVTAAGTGLSYSWRLGGVPVINSAVISGQGTATLTLTNPTATNAGSYDAVVSGTCSPSVTSSSVTVTVNAQATVSAGSNQTICSGITATMAGSFGGGATSATWSTSGTGTFSNNTPTAVYTPSGADITAGSVTLTYTTNDPAGPCGAVNALITLTINAAATVSAGSNQTICSGSTATMAGSFGGGATSATWTTSGSGTFSNNTPTAVYIPSSADITSGSITLTYTTNDPAGPCGAVNASITLTINAAATVSAGSNQTICSGSTATMAGSFGGGATSATWTTSGSGAFSNNTPTAVYTPSGADITSGSVTLTYTTNDPTGPCGAVNASMILTINSNTWSGITSTDWNIGTNWSCGVVPNSSQSDVNIPTIGNSNYPVINATTDVIRNITIASGASVTTTSTGTLTITGTYTNNGTLANNGKIILNGTTQQSFPGSSATVTAMNALEVNNASGVLIDKSFTLSGVLTPTLGTITLGSNNITLHSDAALTARVAQIPTVATAFAPFNYNGTGRFIIEQFMHNPNTYTGEAVGRTWRLMTAPLAANASETIRKAWQNNGNYVPGVGTLVTGPGGAANGFDPTGNNNVSLKIEGSNLALISVPNTNTLTVAASTYTLGGTPANKGYFMFVRGDRNPGNIGVYNSNSTTLSTTGKLQTGDMRYVFPSASNTAGAFTMLPNPYASPVDFDKIWNNTTTTNILRTFFAWNPKKNLYAGGYVTISYNSVSHIYDNSDPVDATNPQTQDIQTNQTVYVQTTATTSPTAVAFDEGDKSGVYKNVFRPVTSSAVGSLRVNLFLANSANTFADGALVQYNADYSNNVDGIDAIKFPNPKENIALLRNGKNLSIERRNVISTEDTVFYNLWNTTQRGYRFEFTTSGFDQQGLTAFLEDSYLKTSSPVNLNGTTTVNFGIDSNAASAKAARFRIVFKPASALPVTFTSVKAYQQNSNINVEWKVDNEMNIKEYQVERSADGTQFSHAITLKAAANNNSTAFYQWPDTKPSAGNNYYRISSVDVNGKIQYSNVVKVFIGKGKSQLMVYPNPVTEGNINVQLINQPKGIYLIKLMNKLGQVILTKQIEHEDGSSTETMQMSKTTAHGSYQLQISKPDDSKTNINVLY